MSGLDSKFIKALGFLPKVNLYALQFPRFEVLNVLNINVANDKYCGHI